VTTQVKAAELKQDSRENNQENNRPASKLDKRYGKIGISAVAAAATYVGDPQTGPGFYRIPYDRD
jgi:hypothetical protein